MCVCWRGGERWGGGRVWVGFCTYIEGGWGGVSDFVCVVYAYICAMTPVCDMIIRMFAMPHLFLGHDSSGSAVILNSCCELSTYV